MISWFFIVLFFQSLATLTVWKENSKSHYLDQKVTTEEVKIIQIKDWNKRPARAAPEAEVGACFSCWFVWFCSPLLLLVQDSDLMNFPFILLTSPSSKKMFWRFDYFLEKISIVRIMRGQDRIIIRFYPSVNDEWYFLHLRFYNYSFLFPELGNVDSLKGKFKKSLSRSKSNNGGGQNHTNQRL